MARIFDKSGLTQALPRRKLTLLSLLLFWGVALGCAPHGKARRLHEAGFGKGQRLAAKAAAKGQASAQAKSSLAATAEAIVKALASAEMERETPEETSVDLPDSFLAAGDAVPLQPASDAIPAYAGEAEFVPAPAPSTELMISPAEVLADVATTKAQAAAIAQTLNQELAKVDQQLDKDWVGTQCSHYSEATLPFAAKKNSGDVTCAMLAELYQAKANEKRLHCMDAVYAAYRLQWAAGAPVVRSHEDSANPTGMKEQGVPPQGALLVQLLSQQKLAILNMKDTRAARALGKVMKLAQKKQCE